MFADVVVVYMNMFDALKNSLQLKVIEKPSTTSYYKKTSKYHRCGGIKEVVYHKHWTPFTRLLKALVFISDEHNSLKPELKSQYDYYSNKFTKERI